MSQISYTSKSKRRTYIVDAIAECISSDKIFNTLDYRRKSEAFLKQYMHQPLQACLKKLYQESGGSLSENTLLAKVKDALLWEGDKKTIINNVRFLGVQHRPDFVIRFDNKLNIAVEIKRGESGASIREGIGQSLVYAVSDFDFVVFLFVDTSKDKKIRESSFNPLSKTFDERNKAFIESIWDNYNIRFRIV